METADARRGAPSRASLRAAAAGALTIGVAAAVVAVAVDGGGYALTSRNSVGMVVWWALALAVATAVWPLERPPRAALATAALLGAFTIFAGLSIAWSESAERAFAEMDRLLLYLGVLVLAVVAGTRANAARWRDGLAAGIVVVGLIALASRLFGDQVANRELLELLPGVSERLSYPVDYWNGLAILVALCFPLLFGAATADRAAPLRGLALAPLPALVAVIYLTSSRGGAATAAIGTVVFCALTARRASALGAVLCAGGASAIVIAALQARPQLVDGPLGLPAATSQGESAALLIAVACVTAAVAYAVGVRGLRGVSVRPRRAARVPLALAAAVIVAGALIAADPVERFDTFKRPPKATGAGEAGFTQSHLLSGGGSGRWQFWDAAAEEWQTRPAAGRGAGSYEAWWTEHGSLPYFVRDAHSLYLESLGELGLVGLALLLAAFGAGLVATGARLRAAGSGEGRVVTASLAATLVAFLAAAAVDWAWELTIVGMIGVVVLGLLVGPASLTTTRPRVDRPPRPLRAAVSLAGLGAIVALAIPLLAQLEIRESQDAVARGDGRAAHEAALAATRLQGWASSPHLQLALVREQIRDLPGARTAIADAIERDRSDWRLWLVSARIETKAGRIESASRHLRRAERLNPRSPLFARR